ncbi:MAG: drug/metabolite transporter (DMT)-like permease [Ascidiaceihabitans sp.]|jgi:drug/metabolite transporter (DMT)-like permease
MTDNTRLGIMVMIASTFVLALQDGVSRHLASEYNVLMIVMLRYWFFATFVITIAMREAGGLRKAATTKQPVLQIARGIILAAEVCVGILAFTYLGLVDTLAIFICYPLIVAALSGPVLGETVGWRRWAAIGVGFIGVMIILQPGRGVFELAGVLPLLSAVMFAAYALMTRFASRRDSTATSFFWTGTVGCVFMTAIAIWAWEPMIPIDWMWMGVLCVTGAIGHWLLIKCYELAEASAVQPFAYFHLVFGTIVGVAVFGEVVEINVAIGAAIVVAAGLFTFWRERLQG